MHFDTHVCFFYNLYILKNAKIIVKKHIKHMKKIVKSHKKNDKNDKSARKLYESMEKQINKMSELHNKIQKSCCKKMEKSVK